MAQISKFHKGSKIWDADTQTDEGTILHDGNGSFTILPNGNVGIGTVIPTTKLEVAGGGRFSGFAIGGQIDIATPNLALGFALTKADTSRADIRYESGRLSFALRGVGTGIPDERMVITEGGNVGIGTTSPAAKLDVSGIVNTSTSYRLGNLNALTKSGTVFTISSGSFTEVRFDVGGASNRLNIQSTGLVGINETSPSAQLQVKSGAVGRIPLIVDTLASQTANLQENKVNGTTQSFVDNRGVFYKTETKLTLTQPTFTETGVGTAIFEYTITEEQINANDVIEITKTSSAIDQTYRVKVPNNSKQVRIWFRPIANHTGMLAEVELTKVANEFVEYYFDDQQVNGVSLLPTETSNYINFAPNNYLAIFVYKNINGTQKMLSLVSNMEI
jgi:hypothetical protein